MDDGKDPGLVIVVPICAYTQVYLFREGVNFVGRRELEDAIQLIYQEMDDWTEIARTYREERGVSLARFLFQQASISLSVTLNQIYVHAPAETDMLDTVAK